MFLKIMKPWLKLIIKSWSPTMRQESRTHRVALDWLFDRIDLDPNIRIGYIDTKHQVADMLTKGNFSRDEWNNLPHLFNISHFSSTCCATNSSLISCPNTMAEKEKVWQNRKPQRRTCLLMFRHVRHPRKVRLRPKVQGYSQPRRNLKAGWEETQNPTRRRVLTREWRMHTLAG